MGKTPSKKKATPKASPAPVPGIPGLGDNEMEYYNKTALLQVPFMGVTDSSLMKENADLYKERDTLKNRAEKAEEKCAKLQKELDRVKGDLKTANTNLETNRKNNAALKKEVEDKKSTISSKNSEIESLNEQLKALKTDKPDVYRQQSDQRIAQLESEKEALKGEKAQLTKDLEKEREEKQALEDSVASLETRLSEANAKAEKLQGELDGLATQDRSKVTVIRSDARTLRSQSFEDGNYDVRLAADRSYITFRRDPQGRALCWDHAIAIPKLTAYIDFDGEKSYEGEESEGFIRITLRRGCFCDRWRDAILHRGPRHRVRDHADIPPHRDEVGEEEGPAVRSYCLRDTFTCTAERRGVISSFASSDRCFDCARVSLLVRSARYARWNRAAID